ncbi:MAG: HAMP domain-containing histidine kinase [Myxococcaceae bacterium]|nr:HAMP domain-containing histidine kinase [Myxococcaceae bacterium]
MTKRLAPAARWATVGASLVVGLVGFRFLHPLSPSTAGGALLFPSVVAGLLISTRLTVLVGLVACALLNATLFLAFGEVYSLQALVTGVTLVVGVGVLVARSRELQNRIRDAEHERALADARARLSTAERLVSLGTLAAGIAHEVNNPLAFILANLRFARDAISDGRLERERDEVLKALSECELGAQRMQAIVADMKRLARDGDTDAVESEPQTVVQSALTLLRTQTRLVRIETDFQRAPLVAASEARLGQVVLNLVINAVQAFAKPDASSRVIIRVRTDDRGWAVIEVEDNGSGMTAEVQRRLFDPFFTTKAPGVGTGLGLPLCQAFVHALGGHITFESSVGRGTTFRVSLPPAGQGLALAPEPVSVTRLSPLKTK